MPNDKVSSAKGAVENMLIYYHQALIEANCSDPKQVIATNLAKMIKLSDEQIEYVVKGSSGLTASKILNDITVLLTKMEQDNKLDKIYIEVIKKNIQILEKMVKVKPIDI